MRRNTNPRNLTPPPLCHALTITLRNASKGRGYRQCDSPILIELKCGQKRDMGRGKGVSIFQEFALRNV